MAVRVPVEIPPPAVPLPSTHRGPAAPASGEPSSFSAILRNQSKRPSANAAKGDVSDPADAPNSKDAPATDSGSDNDPTETALASGAAVAAAAAQDRQTAAVNPEQVEPAVQAEPQAAQPAVIPLAIEDEISAPSTRTEISFETQRGPGDAISTSGADELDRSDSNVPVNVLEDDEAVGPEAAHPDTQNASPKVAREEPPPGSVLRVTTPVADDPATRAIQSFVRSNADTHRSSALTPRNRESGAPVHANARPADRAPARGPTGIAAALDSASTATDADTTDASQTRQVGTQARTDAGTTKSAASLVHVSDDQTDEQRSRTEGSKGTLPVRAAAPADPGVSSNSAAVGHGVPGVGHAGPHSISSAPATDVAALTGPPEAAAVTVDRLANVVSSHVADRQWHVTLRLDPPELGQLQLDVSMRDEALTVRMHVASEAVRRLVEDRLPELRSALAQHDLHVGRAEIVVRGADTTARDPGLDQRQDAPGRSATPHHHGGGSDGHPPSRSDDGRSGWNAGRGRDPAEPEAAAGAVGDRALWSTARRGRAVDLVA